MNTVPIININNIQLTKGQFDTIHVALCRFMDDLINDPNQLGNDEMGKSLTEAYKKSIKRIWDTYL